jgi:hypothetical protein
MAVSETPKYLQGFKIPSLNVEFSSRKWNTVITDGRNSDQALMYTVNFQKAIKSPDFIFKSAPEQRTIGPGTLHTISINAEYELHDQKDTLAVQRCWQTVYTHRSSAFSGSSCPVTMTWSSSGGFKQWNFVCMDENQQTVPRFSTNIWNLKNIGKIELLVPNAESDRAREEIVVTGLLPFYCTALRSCSILSLLRAALANPGEEKITPF